MKVSQLRILIAEMDPDMEVLVRVPVDLGSIVDDLGRVYKATLPEGEEGIFVVLESENCPDEVDFICPVT